MPHPSLSTVTFSLTSRSSPPLPGAEPNNLSLATLLHHLLPNHLHLQSPNHHHHPRVDLPSRAQPKTLPYPLFTPCFNQPNLLPLTFPNLKVPRSLLSPPPLPLRTPPPPFSSQILSVPKNHGPQTPASLKILTNLWTGTHCRTFHLMSMMISFRRICLFCLLRWRTCFISRHSITMRLTIPRSLLGRCTSRFATSLSYLTKFSMSGKH